MRKLTVGWLLALVMFAGSFHVYSNSVHKVETSSIVVECTFEDHKSLINLSNEDPGDLGIG